MARSYTLINTSRQQILLRNLRIADTFWQRFTGLMGRTLAESEGLLIRPCNSIHCFFMKIPIDVLFLDKDSIVIHIISRMKPWRVSPVVRGATAVIEGPAGAFEQVASGDHIEIQANVISQGLTAD